MSLSRNVVNFGGCHLWARCYFCGSINNITYETVKIDIVLQNHDDGKIKVEGE
jgi:REP element-mobilizing transposase RayT